MSKVGVAKKENNVRDIFKRWFGKDGITEIKTAEQACEYYNITAMQWKELKNTGRIADLEKQCSGSPTEVTQNKGKGKKPVYYKIIPSEETPKKEQKKEKTR